MKPSPFQHIRERRRRLAEELDIAGQFTAWEESCVPSYCHPNVVAAAMSWWRLLAAVELAKRTARLEAVLDFGAAVGELRRLLSNETDRYDFIEQNDLAVKYLAKSFPEARRQQLDSAPPSFYDCIFALDALEHNRNYQSLLEALVRLLRPGGTLIITGPTENWIYRMGRRVAGFDAHYHETNIYMIETAAASVLRRVALRRLPPALVLFRLSAWRKD